MICFFLLGLLNNLGYVLVWVSSGDLSSSLNQPNLVSLYLLVMQIQGLLTRLCHMKFCIKTNYKLKFIIIAFLSTAGYLSFFFILNNTDYDHKSSLKSSFFYSLIPTMLLGSVQTLGEVSIVGYLKKYPSTWINSFSSGTGLAGALGATIKIIFVLSESKSSIMWLIMSATGFIYFISYIIAEGFYNSDIEDKKLSEEENTNDNKNENSTNDNYTTIQAVSEKIEYNIENQKDNDKSNENNLHINHIKHHHHSIIETIQENVNNENDNNKELTYTNFKESLKQSGYYVINIAFAYWCSYNIIHLSERYEMYEYITNKNVSNHVKLKL